MIDTLTRILNFAIDMHQISSLGESDRRNQETTSRWSAKRFLLSECGKGDAASLDP